MKSKKALSAASYPSRIFKNDVTIKCPGCMVLCSGGCLTIAANSKNKEITTSLFFSRRQRSKVIFRVTQKALRDFLTHFRKYLALRGGDLSVARDNLFPHAPDGCISGLSKGKPVVSSPDGRYHFGLPEVRTVFNRTLFP